MKRVQTAGPQAQIDDLAKEQLATDPIIATNLTNDLITVKQEVSSLREQVCDLAQATTLQERERLLSVQLEQFGQSWSDTRQDLRNEMASVRAEIRALQEQGLDQTRSVAKGDSARFLVTEFEQLVEFWKATDARNAGYVNLYLTACTVIMAGSAVVITYLSTRSSLNEQFLVALGGILALGLFVLGLYLLRSLVTTRKIKTQYQRALNMIRGYFVDQDPGLRDYLLLPFSSRSVVSSSSADQIPLRISSLFLGWESLLFAIVLGCAAWLIEPRLLLISILGLSALAAILCYTLLYRQTMRWFGGAKWRKSSSM